MFFQSPGGVPPGQAVDMCITMPLVLYMSVCLSVCLFDVLIMAKVMVIPENIHTTPTEQRKLEVNPPTPFGCPNTFTILSETIFSPLPLRTAKISSVGGVWIFPGTTQ